MASTQPQLLGLKKSFGYGDRLGLATPGHLAANNKYDFAPIFAQQSIREMTRTKRTPKDVMDAAVATLADAGYDKPWGADADHLKTEADVAPNAAAGFTFFTIDPSEYVNDKADEESFATLAGKGEAMYSEGIFPDIDWESRYLGYTFKISDDLQLRFSRETLYRAASKYARAIAHCQRMVVAIHNQTGGHNSYEIEVSVDETESPTSPEEHLFIAQELKHRGIPVVSLAPRFIGDFEKGIDYKGDLEAFEASLKQHVAIARKYGPYKISVHSGSDKFGIYPILGRVCGDLLHVKTAGTSYLEALRTVFRVNRSLFNEILRYAAGRFAEDRRTYHISTTDDDVKKIVGNTESAAEADLFEHPHGRQLLHVTFGSVLGTGCDDKGRPFRESLLETLEAHQDEHRGALETHFTKHLEALCRG